MALTLVTAPSIEPITTATAKAHLRVDSTADDTLIASLITAARRRYDGRDGMLGRALLSQTWDLWLDEFPCRKIGGKTEEWIELPLSPASSVTYLKYTDGDGVVQTLATTEYENDLKSEPARIFQAYGKSWPATRTVPNAVNVRFVAGYGANASDVPQDIIQAMLLTIGHWYENRGAPGAELPSSIDALVSNYRMFWVG